MSGCAWERYFHTESLSPPRYDLGYSWWKGSTEPTRPLEPFTRDKSQLKNFRLRLNTLISVIYISHSYIAQDPPPPPPEKQHWLCK